MGSNIQFRINKGLTSSGGSNPLSGSYLVAGGTETDIDQILAPGTNQLVTVSFGPAGNSSGNLQSIEIFATQGCTLTTNAVGAADVQTVTITGTPTGGSFPIGFGGQVTEVAYSASAATIQTALQALSSIGAGNVTCTGGPLPGTPVVCTFAGTKATGLQALMTTYSGSLTGGSSPAVAVTHTTPGTPQDTILVTAAIPILWDIASIDPCPFAAAVSAWYLTNANTTRLQARILTL